MNQKVHILLYYGVSLIFTVIDEANVNPDTQLVDPLLSFNFTITCTIPSHPLVNITWAVGSIPSVTRQLPVGFRGPSVSELSLNSGDLSGTLAFNCSAELSGNISNATATVNAYCKLNSRIVNISTYYSDIG